MPSFARFAARSTVVCLASLLASAVFAAADTIHITSGALQMGSTSGAVSIAGDEGFTMLGYVDITGGIYGPWEACSVPACGPGSSIPLRSTWSGNDLPGMATLDGQVYNTLGSFSVSQSAVIDFFGTAIAPPLEVGDTAVVTAPFAFTGLFLQPTSPSLYSTTVAHDLVGSGVATLWLTKNFEGTTWRAVASRYEFAPLPTPEPATLVLVGSGIAIAFARRRIKGSRR